MSLNWREEKKFNFHIFPAISQLLLLHIVLLHFEWMEGAGQANGHASCC